MRGVRETAGDYLAGGLRSLRPIAGMSPNLRLIEQKVKVYYAGLTPKEFEG